MKRPRVVIIGGGFGGLNAAKNLRNANVDITIIDRTNHHLFQPLLYQVATAALSPVDIARPIRAVFSDQPNVSVLMGEVVSINKEAKNISLSDGKIINFDYLIIAIGSKHSYFGRDEWEKDAPGLKTLNDALSIREKMLSSFEKAELTDNEQERKKHMTFVVIGGGPTGVEMAGAIAEISRQTMKKDFRKIDTRKTRIILLEGMDRILPVYDPKLSEHSQKSLEKLGVEVKVKTLAKNITSEGVQLENEFIETENIVWAAGNVIPPLLKTLNTELDRVGRAIVENDTSLSGYPDIFVIGDAAHFKGEDNKPLPGLAPVAIQQGKYVAGVISKQQPKGSRKPFKYFDKGTMATIGRNKAIVEVGKFKVTGFIAWIMWIFVHLMFLIGFRNKVSVILQWGWLYLTYQRVARLIIGNRLNSEEKAGITVEDTVKSKLYR